MKKISLAICLMFAVGFIFSGCSKSPVGPSMSSMSAGAFATNTTITTTCVTTSNGGASTSVSTQPTTTVTTQAGNTGVASVDLSTGVNSSITGTSGSGSTGTSGSGNVSTGSTLNLTFYSTLNAALADVRTITISSSTIPTFNISYNGVTGTNLFFMVNDSTTEHYMNVLVPSLPTSIRFGVTPTGGTENTVSKTLIAGTYTVIATVLDSSYSTTGYAYGTVIVQ